MSKNVRGENLKQVGVSVGGPGPKYTLVTGDTLVAGTPTETEADVIDGSYLLSLVASDWNGATIKLRYLGPDGVTWLDALAADGVTAAALTANGTIGVVVGSGASLHLIASGGNPEGVYGGLG